MHVMSGDVETGSTRPRPLSGGFWTLLSWLRGDEHSSSDSISSAGSDRTAVSFAFLAPAHYRGGAAPLVLPPPGPPTDSYKKRIHDCNLRRQYDRDTTLHRKYGLFRGEGSVGFDVATLPTACRTGASITDRQDRERRAVSESFQRRAAHVPGKRRAPPPPTALGAVNGAYNLTNRRNTRKRPAPQPPNHSLERSKEESDRVKGTNIPTMDSQASQDAPNTSSMGCKPKKYTKKEISSKDTKKQEKSFLKQIFENKKRNSSSDTSPIKILPNISELDKQAAEMIESSKKTHKESKKYVCVQCSKKYDKSAENCLTCEIKNKELSYNKDPIKLSTGVYTQTDKESNTTPLDKKIDLEEKLKLKEMLKEMKDSLPKRTKLDNMPINNKEIKENPKNDHIIGPAEAPTLRIGTHLENDKSYQEPVLAKKPVTSVKNVVQENLIKNTQKPETSNAQNPNNGSTDKRQNGSLGENNITNTRERKALNTPLKISSLLNPVYIPKQNIVQEIFQTAAPPIKESTNVNVIKTTPADPIYVKTADAVRNILIGACEPSSSKQVAKGSSSEHRFKPTTPVNKTNITAEKKMINETKPIHNDIDQRNVHARRRELVNQLEQSIASGDERAAADAAVKLAQLRLSCSVLSFTSQILQQPSAGTSKTSDNTSVSNKDYLKKGCPTDEIKQATSRSVTVSKYLNDQKLELSPPKEIHRIKVPETTQVKEKTAFGEKDIDVKVVNTKTEDIKPSKIETPIQNVSLHKPEIEKNIRDKNKSPPKTDVATQSNCIKIVNVPEKNLQPSTSKATPSPSDDVLTIAVWVEDKEKVHGPIQLKIGRQAAVGELRRQAERSLGLPARLQRWIVGRELCCNDDTALVALAGPNLDAPFYLCLVESDKAIEEQLRELSTNKIESKKNGNSSNVYTELVKLESQAAVPNPEAFECEICMEHCASGDGVVLRECVHSFCRQCLADVIRHCEEAAVSCPAMGCPGSLHEREIRALVNQEEYDRWLDRGLAAAESGTRNAFHCRTRDCPGWALCETGVRRFPCPVCKHTNCVPCQAIHEGETCDQYRTKLKEAENSATTVRDEETQALIESLISRGEALQCPECSAVITKKWGCDWVKCRACHTEICWVTRGRRWGPAGRGDTSAGCQCGLDGKRCHPSCGYCH